jgi:hypothetical protein
MRKTGAGNVFDGVLRDRLMPLPSSAVSTTVRLPLELVSYLGGMVAGGDAKDKTDAVIRCIRRHQETQPGVDEPLRLEAGQAELAQLLAGLAGQLQDMRDDIVLAGSKTSDGIAGVQQNLQVLLAMRLYGAEPTPPTGGAGGGSMSPALPVTLMSGKEPAASPWRPKP